MVIVVSPDASWIFTSPSGVVRVSWPVRLSRPLIFSTTRSPIASFERARLASGSQSSVSGSGSVANMVFDSSRNAPVSDLSSRTRIRFPRRRRSSRERFGISTVMWPPSFASGASMRTAAPVGRRRSAAPPGARCCCSRRAGRLARVPHENCFIHHGFDLQSTGITRTMASFLFVPERFLRLLRIVHLAPFSDTFRGQSPVSLCGARTYLRTDDWESDAPQLERSNFEPRWPCTDATDPTFPFCVPFPS